MVNNARVISSGYDGDISFGRDVSCGADGDCRREDVILFKDNKK